MSDNPALDDLEAFIGFNPLQTSAPPVDRGPLYGYDENNLVRGPDRVFTEARRFRPAGTTIQQAPTPAPIYIDNVMSSLQGLDTESRQMLAMEMFAFVPGVYRDIDEIFLQEGPLAGQLNDEAYYYAVDQTVKLAESFGPEGIGNNPLYIDILMGDGERSTEEIQQAFMARAAQVAASKRGGGGGGGGGRVIQYIDPVALSGAAKDAFVGVTGRKATKAEQQAFVKNIHGLQASGATGIDVAGRAEGFAESSAPVEAGAMNYSSAANVLMKAIGL